MTSEGEWYDVTPAELAQMQLVNPGIAPLLAFAGEALTRWLNREPRGPLPYDGVKLIHSEDLQSWREFPRCQDFDGTTYGEYRSQSRQLRKTAKLVRGLLKARAELSKLDSDEVVVERTELVRIPGSVLRGPKTIPLDDAAKLPGTWRDTSDGEIVSDGGSDALIAPAGWRGRFATIRASGPSRIVNAHRISELRAELAQVTDDQRQMVEEVTTSRFAHPVLFVSHRWESEEHPDPSHSQLERLHTLHNCWIIYDYSSFPQLPRTPAEQASFDQILGSMDELIKNVVILASPDYLTRGWLVFEYLVASLGGSIVCDEVGDPAFASLRDWFATEAPATANPYRDSWESQQVNHINRMKLSAVNDVLPLYQAAEFRIEHDSSEVRALLVRHLKQRLPPRKRPQDYVGEWETVPWTDDDVDLAFRGDIPIPDDTSLKVRPFRVDVPVTIEDAVERNYTIRKMTWKDKAKPFGGWLR